MKLPIVAIAAFAMFILAAIVTIPFINNDTRGEHNVDMEVAIPPIDKARSDITETATFALG